MVCIFIEMHMALLVAACMLFLAHQLDVVETAGYCPVDAAFTYTGDNRLYLFRGSKYGRWDDAENRLEFVKGEFSFLLNILCRVT